MEQVTLIALGSGLTKRETEREASIELSVIIPISERYDDLQEFYLQYTQALSLSGYAYEFIFVLDGPDHDAFQTLLALKKQHPEITVITLNRWFGEAAALSVGFEKARGTVILTLASYFQVEPHEVHRLLKKLVEGDHDLVLAWRYPRIDSLINRAQSRGFHWFIRMLTGTKFHDVSCGLRAMKRKVAQEIPLYGDLHRFFPLLAYQRGFNIAEVPVQQSPYDGKRRLYRPGVYLRRLLDILTIFFLFKFTKKPLRFFGLVGSAIFGSGATIMGYLGIDRLLGSPLGGRPLVILGALLTVFGIQLFSVGLLGEIIIFTHTHDVKDYQIKEIVE
jgi:glycosyltransferase involved in cell wall biosynthesis